MVRGVLLDSGDTMIGPRGGRWNPRFDFEAIVDTHHPGVAPGVWTAAFAAGQRFLDGDAGAAPRAAYHRAILAEVGIDPGDDLLAALEAPRSGGELVEVFPDVEPALIALRDRGLALAVVSNAWPELDAIYTDLGLRGYFDGFVISAVLGCAKPDARIYVAGSDALGLEPGECLFVDDDPAYVAAAVRLGYQGLVIDRSGRGGDLCDLAELVAWVDRRSGVSHPESEG